MCFIVQFEDMLFIISFLGIIFAQRLEGALVVTLRRVSKWDPLLDQRVRVEGEPLPLRGSGVASSKGIRYFMLKHG